MAFFGENSCDAWVNFVGTGTVSIRDSFNVSSITDHATGEYSVTFSTAFSNNDYCAVADAGGTSGIPTTKITTTDEADFFTTKIQYQVLSTVSNGAMDNNINTIIFIGDN